MLISGAKIAFRAPERLPRDARAALREIGSGAETNDMARV